MSSYYLDTTICDVVVPVDFSRASCYDSAQAIHEGKLAVRGFKIKRLDFGQFSWPIIYAFIGVAR